MPDEKKDNSDRNKIRFAPRMMDALDGEDDSDDSKAKVEEMFSLLVNIANNGDQESALKFYNLISSGDGVIGIIDAFWQELPKKLCQLNPSSLSSQVILRSGPITGMQ